MNVNDVIRAWTDRDFRTDLLTKDEVASIPEHPTGVADIEDEALLTVTGGCGLTSPECSCAPPGVHASC